MFCPCLFCPSHNFEHCLALPTRWRTSVHILFNWYLLCDPRRCDNSRKVPTRAEARQHVLSTTHCHLDKTNMDKTSQQRFSPYLPLVIFQLERRMERKTRMSMRKRRVMEQTMPSLRTGTGSMNTQAYRNQGSGSLDMGSTFNSTIWAAYLYVARN